jgi:hypothetical protein
MVAYLDETRNRDVRRELCADWEIDEIETGMNPHRSPTRPPVTEWCDIEIDDEIMEWAGNHLRRAFVIDGPPRRRKLMTADERREMIEAAALRLAARQARERELYGTLEDGI